MFAGEAQDSVARRVRERQMHPESLLLEEPKKLQLHVASLLNHDKVVKLPCNNVVCAPRRRYTTWTK